ncbi:MAG: tetratricopeptide repeat protein [Chitinophagales bacterium]|nr:tetratricopeptide repeat protein [Chitinophagales bacterium]
MAKEKHTQEHHHELSGLDKLQNWYEANAKNINIGMGVVLALLVLGIGYKAWYKPKREVEAQNAIFKAQYWFDKDSTALALNDPLNGFLTVANKYGSTKAGNLAKYYAGLCYYDLADYANAEKYLSKFCTKEDKILGSLAIGTLADAQMENGKQSAALKNYKKAAGYYDNEATTPYLLYKAGMAFNYAGKPKDALGFFKDLKEQYPNSTEASEADKYIGMLEASI